MAGGRVAGDRGGRVTVAGGRARIGCCVGVCAPVRVRVLCGCGSVLCGCCAPVWVSVRVGRSVRPCAGRSHWVLCARVCPCAGRSGVWVRVGRSVPVCARVGARVRVRPCGSVGCAPKRRTPRP